MKTSAVRIELQHRAAEALRSLLSQLSTIKLKEISHKSPVRSGKTSFVAQIDVVGHSHALACHVKSNADRATLRAALEQLCDEAAHLSPHSTPVLIAPHLPPEAQAVCREFNAAFLDLEGNARLMIGETFIVRRSIPARGNPAVSVETLSVGGSNARPSAPTVFIPSTVPGPSSRLRVDTVATVGVA